MTYSYRHLSDSDVPVLMELLNVFGEAFEDPQSYQGAVPTQEYMQALLARQYFIALVALDEAGRVVGGLAAYELEKFEQERSEIYIYDLAVGAAHRRDCRLREGCESGNHAVQQRKRAIVELHHHAAQRGQRRLDLDQMQDQRLVRAKHRPGGDAKQE